MSETHTAPPANPFGAVSEMWMSAWLQPWSALQTWAEFWTGPWQAWLQGVAAAPTAWLPALAGERHDEPTAIDFFLPWLPHVEALVKPLEGMPGEEAMRVMLRAALPPLAAFGGSDWLMVDAVVSKKGAEAEKPKLEAAESAGGRPTVLEAKPAPATPVKAITAEAVRKAASTAPASPAASAPPEVQQVAAVEDGSGVEKKPAAAAKPATPRGRRKAKPAEGGGTPPSA